MRRTFDMLFLAPKPLDGQRSLPGVWWALVALLASEVHVPAQSSRIVLPFHPQYRELRINEIQPVNRATTYDRTQTPEPWIEIFNPGKNPISLDLYGLSDSYTRLQRWRFPRGRTIFPGQHIVVWMDGESAQTTQDELHASFRLKPLGGSIALSVLVNGIPTIVDHADYPSIPTDFSYGLAPSTAGSDPTQYRVFAQPTPWEPNIILPAVVLNEWLVRTATGGPGWIELYNGSRETVDLSALTIRLSGPGFQVPPFTLPRGRKIAPGGFYRLIADENVNANNTDPVNIHLPWVLPSSSFSLQLESDGFLVNQINTKNTSPTRSESRYPDGARFYEYVDRATPLAPNVGLPNWITQPTSRVMKAGKAFKWKAEAFGTAPITYRWFNAQSPNLPLVTGPEFTLLSAKPGDSGLYRCVASNIAGTLLAEFRIEVFEPPGITLQTPVEIPLRIGEKLALPAGVLGTGPFSFQWKRNGINILSANNQDYRKDRLDLEDGGSYTAVIRNATGSTLSVPVRVIMEVPEVAPEDFFAGRF
ncbi:MAG: hypothetical protein FJ405_08840, partial [Verrucomicrobia bacterium]|nr:hypothetical protein [Verrucomicrobiota bacterium]